MRVCVRTADGVLVCDDMRAVLDFGVWAAWDHRLQLNAAPMMAFTCMHTSDIIALVTANADVG